MEFGRFGESSRNNDAFLMIMGRSGFMEAAVLEEEKEAVWFDVGDSHEAWR